MFVRFRVSSIVLVDMEYGKDIYGNFARNSCTCTIGIGIGIRVLNVAKKNTTYTIHYSQYLCVPKVKIFLPF